MIDIVDWASDPRLYFSHMRWRVIHVSIFLTVHLRCTVVSHSVFRRCVSHQWLRNRNDDMTGEVLCQLLKMGNASLSYYMLDSNNVTSCNHKTHYCTIQWTLWLQWRKRKQSIYYFVSKPLIECWASRSEVLSHHAYERSY